MPLVPALRRRRQADLCKFEVSLVYKVSSRPGRAVTQKILFQKKKKEIILFYVYEWVLPA